jgi:hypothetical protein
MHSQSSVLEPIQRYRYSTHFPFTVAQALGFSVFTSLILKKDLSQSFCNLKSHMEFSCHSLIPSLPFLLSHLQSSPDLDPIPFRLLFCTPFLLYITSSDCALLWPLRTDTTKNTVLYDAHLLVPLPNNEYSSIVACVFVKGICLPTHCLTMGIHVTISISPVSWNVVLNFGELE